MAETDMADHVGAAARPSPVDVPALYDRHWRAMVRLAVLLVDDVASAEDVVQDAFVALHRRGGGLRDPNAALAYLRATVVNLSRSVIRRRQTARRHLTVSEPEATPAADAEVLLRDEHRTALAAVGTLPRRQREVIVLRYWSGLSEREIAEALGISAGAVKSTASRAIAALHARLHHVLGEPS
jgi:RNA polymerase sigma-70 factor (sigma-E family)